MDLGNIKKWVNNLFKPSLGGISKNDIWVLEISCILASPANFMARTYPMLQNLTLPLSEDCVLSSVAHPATITCLCIPPVTLLMSGCCCLPAAAYQLLHNSNICCICAATDSVELLPTLQLPLHLLLLELQHLQLKSILNQL